jgi:hypothetical protein
LLAGIKSGKINLARGSPATWRHAIRRNPLTRGGQPALNPPVPAGRPVLPPPKIQEQIFLKMFAFKNRIFLANYKLHFKRPTKTQQLEINA